jgi:hypothetical protein
MVVVIAPTISNLFSDIKDVIHPPVKTNGLLTILSLRAAASFI